MHGLVRSQQLAIVRETEYYVRARGQNSLQPAEDEQQRPSATGQAVKKLLGFGSRTGNSNTKPKANSGAAKSDPCKKPALVPISGLQRLPIEILELITAQLDEVTTICLKLTSRSLHHQVPVTPPSERSHCTRWLLACRREIDSDGSEQRLACVLCKGTVPKHYFTELCDQQALSNLPYCLDPRNISLPPEARYCSYHAPLTAVRKYESLAQMYMNTGTRWVEVQQLRCMHCGNAINTVNDTRKNGCKTCWCNVCPRVTGSAYIRYGRAANTSYHGHPMLREVHMAEGKKDTFCRERGKKLPVPLRRGSKPNIVVWRNLSIRIFED